MKLIASVLFAAALASPSGRGRSGSGSGKSGSPASPGSGRSASSMWDDVLSGIMGSPSHDGDKHSGKSHSGRPRPGHGDHDKPEHHGGKPEHEKPEHHDQKPQKGEKGCNGCGGAVNSNYAPMNSNVQNFVNIETDVNTNVNMNMGGFGYKKPNMHHDWDKEHHDDKDPAEHPAWGWDELKDLDHGDESMGWPVWGGAGDISMRDIIHVIGGKLGIEKPEDIHDLLEKEEVRNILQGFLHSLNNAPDPVPATTGKPDVTTGMDMTTKNQRPKTA